MSLIDDIRAEVDQIAEDRDMADHRAFGYWFLESYQDFNQEDAEEIIIDGAWDNGRDAVYYDEESQTLHIYQFKYSADLNYVREAFRDIQRGLESESARLPSCRDLKLYVICLSNVYPTLRGTISSTKGHITTWLRAHYPHLTENYEVIVIDIDYFRRMWDRIIGISTTLHFISDPLEYDDSLIGLIDPKGLKTEVDNDDLLTFNIRKFLGSKGSVNTEINRSLEDDQRRSRFWKMNNGLVCLCTDYVDQTDRTTDPIDYKWKFTNYTIVNGAQTITTISKYLRLNPIAQPVWVLAKIIKVEDTQVDLARELTKSSNTQNTTNDKDMRAIDPVHRIIQPWLNAEFELNYIFKRGGAPVNRNDPNNIFMKDLCQAYVAKTQPNISFARPSFIFSNNSTYTSIYPTEEIINLQNNGTEAQKRDFLLQRIIPTKILLKVRAHLKQATRGNPEEYMWKATAYHLVWLYFQAFGQLQITDNELIYERLDNVVDQTIEDMYSGLRDYLISSNKVIPKDLKNTTVMDDLRSRGILFNTLHRRSKDRIRVILTTP